MLRVEAVDKSFDGFMAVNQANLVVGKGKVVAVIGPNGAGKTTLFNLISGQLKPDKGRIILKGEDITDLTPYQICRRGVARAFQVVNIFPRLTVFECVQVAVLSQKEQDSNFFSPASNLFIEETSDILESVGLLDESDSVSSLLSHGDQKILEIAIALGNEPELLILDEPTAGMSPEETMKTVELIKRLAEQFGLTILFCEHDMETVFSIAQEIMVMHQGRSIIQGIPDEVKSNREVQDAYLGGRE